MTINQLANQNKSFYDNNYDKILNKINSITKDTLYKINKDDVFDLGEIIDQMIFVKVGDYYRDSLNLNMTEQFEFCPSKSAFDAGSLKNMYELKVRRRSLDSNFIRSGGLLKKSKWEFCRTKLLDYNFFYINICFDRIFIWNLNSFSANINFDYRHRNFNQIYARNVNGNQKIDFLKLEYRFCHEIEFYNELSKPLIPLFNFQEMLEDVKTERKISI